MRTAGSVSQYLPDGDTSNDPSTKMIPQLFR
jgi:hypothetical protein